MQMLDGVSVQVTVHSAHSSSSGSSVAPGAGTGEPGSNIVPLQSFNQLLRKPYRYPASLLKRVAESVQVPTAVQQHAIPIIQSGGPLPLRALHSCLVTHRQECSMK